MQEQIETVGILILKGVVLPVVGLIVTYASLKLPQWIKTKVKNQSAEGVLERLSLLAMNVVMEVQQTFVSTLVDPTPEQLKEALAKALASLKAHLGPKGLKELEDVLGLDGDTAVERLIITFLESAVHTLKMSPAPIAGALVEVNPPATPPAA